MVDRKGSVHTIGILYVLWPIIGRARSRFPALSAPDYIPQCAEGAGLLQWLSLLETRLGAARRIGLSTNDCTESLVFTHLGER